MMFEIDVSASAWTYVYAHLCLHEREGLATDPELLREFIAAMETTMRIAQSIETALGPPRDAEREES